MQIIKKRALSSRAALASTIANRLDALKHTEEDGAVSVEDIRDLQAALPLDEASAERASLRIIRSVIPHEEKQRKAEIRALNGIKKLLSSIKRPDPKISALVAEAIVLREQQAKVIVFTEYLDTLNAIREAMDASEVLRGRHIVLRGGMSPYQRARVQDRFEKEDFTVLLATDAASEGLNLQRACHHMIHVELPWNPNRLEQRNGRIDRYGQTRPPKIQYLFYPDSPEDDVLHQLIRKIEQMQKDRISTPDILGVLAGLEALDHGLVKLDPDEADIAGRKTDLIKMFDDRTADFIGSSRAFALTSQARLSADDVSKIAENLGRADVLKQDDAALEQMMREVLGAAAIRPTEIEGVFRIEIPPHFRDTGVLPMYPAVTFMRSVAVRFRRTDVEFITPMHPLVYAVSADARRRLLHVYPDDGGIQGAPRLAARRTGGTESPSVIFTFVGTIKGEAGIFEEKLLAIRVSIDGREFGNPAENLRFLVAEKSPGEVPSSELDKVFNRPFTEMAACAQECARRHLVERSEVLRKIRADETRELREDLERYVSDRLREIDEEETLAKGLVDEKTGQRRLFSIAEIAASGFKTRREAVKTQAEIRRQELDAFATLADSDPPSPLGALFLMPDDPVQPTSNT